MPCDVAGLLNPDANSSEASRFQLRLGLPTVRPTDLATGSAGFSTQLGGLVLYGWRADTATPDSLRSSIRATAHGRSVIRWRRCLRLKRALPRLMSPLPRKVSGANSGLSRFEVLFAPFRVI